MGDRQGGGHCLILLARFRYHIRPMTKQLATNITWHEGTVTTAERLSNLGQKGATVWMTGLSASGKSTIAVALEQVLIQRGHHAYRLDGDNIRHGLNKNL